MRLFQSPLLRDRLERQVQTRTGRRIRNLVIEMRREAVILRGETTSYYLKQLAQHGVRDILPYVRLENAIAVEGSRARGTGFQAGLRNRTEWEACPGATMDSRSCFPQKS